MTGDPSPNLVALAGPNGAGKSTAGALLLRDTLGILEFVNADLIAHGLSPFAPERAAITAGRMMRHRLRQLASQRIDFAFETTLSGRTYVRWINELIDSGYHFHIIFLWLPSPEQAIARVAGRVRLGGHHVPDEDVRRRYHTGVRNFFHLYRPLATTWQVYASASEPGPRLIAAGSGDSTLDILDEPTWSTILKGVRDEL